MGFAALYPSYEVFAAITAPKHGTQNCCSVKTVTAIPARSRSSTLCKSSTPAPTLSAICIHWRCRIRPALKARLRKSAYFAGQIR